jgi:hypothetical protein
MNYAANIELNSDIVGRKIAYTANHGEQVNPSGPGPFIYKALEMTLRCAEATLRCPYTP